MEYRAPMTSAARKKIASPKCLLRLRIARFRLRNVPLTDEIAAQTRLTRLIKRITEFAIMSCFARRSGIDPKRPGFSFPGISSAVFERGAWLIGRAYITKNTMECLTRRHKVTELWYRRETRPTSLRLRASV